MRFPSSKYTKMRLRGQGGASLRTPLRELTALPRSPSSWWKGAHCLPRKNPTPALGPAGLEFSNFGPWPQKLCIPGVKTKRASFTVRINCHYGDVAHLFNAVFFAGDFGHFGYRFNVVLKSHLKTLAECQVRLWIQWKSKLLG